MFRKQAIEANRTRLHGTVFIATPLKYWVAFAFIIIIILTATIFGAFSSFSRIEPVRGVIVPADGYTIVRAPASGTLQNFSVREGDLISADQYLGHILIQREAALQGTRLQAELDRLLERVNGIRHEIKKTSQLTNAEREVIRSDMARIKKDIAGMERMLRSYEAVYLAMNEAFAIVRELTLRNLRPAVTVAEEQLSLFNAEQQAIQAENDITNLRSDLSVLAAREVETVARGELSVLQLEAELKAALSEHKILSANEAFRIASNSAGWATTIMVKDGDSVQADVPLFSILPINEGLQAELYVPSRAIGFIKSGLSVRLLIDAFPYQKFGTIEGEIVEVAASVLQPNTQDLMLPANEPVFRVRVRLTDAVLNSSGVHYQVRPGMALTGNIILERRSILAWILEPAFSVMNRS